MVGIGVGVTHTVEFACAYRVEEPSAVHTSPYTTSTAVAVR
jgi:hypothetical protein